MASRYAQSRYSQRAATAGVTRWRRLTAAAIEATTDPSTILTSVTDTSTYLSVDASALSSGTAYPQPCVECQWPLIDPDTGATVNWTSGRYIGVQVWIQFVGSNYPTAARTACWIGVGNAASNSVIVAGLYRDTSNRKVGAALWSAADKNTVTWGADDIIYGDLVVAPLASGSNVLLSYGSAMQMDDSTSPARVTSALAGSLTTTAAGGLRILGYFAGDVDVRAYYRLERTPEAP